jgi:hypothetical protein
MRVRRGALAQVAVLRSNLCAEPKARRFGHSHMYSSVSIRLSAGMSNFDSSDLWMRQLPVGHRFERLRTLLGGKMDYEQLRLIDVGL